MQEITLDLIATFEMGQSPDSRYVSDTQVGMPFLQGNAEFGVVHPQPRLWCRQPKKTSQAGDCLISVRAPVGALNLADQAYCIGRGLAAVRFPGANPRYGAHLLAFFAPYLRRKAQGTTFEAVGKDDLATLVVNHFSDQEQARIAELLDTLDETIRSVQMVLDKKNIALVGLLQSLFSPFVGSQVPTHRTVLGDYPSTWKVVPLRECVRSETIITYGIVQAGPHVPDGVPYIRTGDMSGDALTAEGLLRTATRIDQAYARSKVRTGEIVCAIRATVGKVLPVPPELDGANLTQGTARIAPAQDINPSFLLWAIRSPRVQREMGLTVKGTTFAEITLEALREIPIPRPCDREEQNKIAATLDGLDSEIRTERAQLTKLQSIKSGLTSDLLTGRVGTIHH